MWGDGQCEPIYKPYLDLNFVYFFIFLMTSIFEYPLHFFKIYLLYLLKSECWVTVRPQCEPITIFQPRMPDFHTDTDNFFPQSLSFLHR